MTVSTIILMAQNGSEAGPGIVPNIILFGSIIAIFYFMIIRPQQKRQKERQKMLDAMQKGDKVIIAGGIYGTIAGMEEKYVLVEIASNVKVKVDRQAVSNVVSDTPAPTN